MTTKDMNALRKMDNVLHSRYGECCVMGMIREFGPTIIPLTEEGLYLLYADSGMNPGVPYLASDYKRNLKLNGRKSIIDKLELLQRSINAADPSGYDVVIKDLKKQIDELVKAAQ